MIMVGSKGKRRKMPRDAPIKKPCGPFFEIVQPGIGCFQAAVTGWAQQNGNILIIMYQNASMNCKKYEKKLGFVLFIFSLLMLGRTMPHGKREATLATSCSAKCLVNVYVLG